MWDLKGPICWADPSGNTCRGELTKEHVVSNSILKLLGPLSFSQSGKPKKLGKGSYVLRMLCSHHNSELSDYDKEMLRLLSTWNDILTKPCAEENVSQDITIEIDGRKIERWLAKTLVNFTFFHSLMGGKQRRYFYPDAHSVVDILYGSGDFVQPFGLYSGFFHGREKVGTRKTSNFMCAQETDVVHISKETGVAASWRLPWCYAVSFGGIQLLGYFNATGLSDKDYLAITQKPFERSLKNLVDYRHLEVGCSPLTTTGERNDRVFHNIKLTWTESV